MIKRKFLFMGPPASGKGTQTALLAKNTGLVHVDTGSLLRNAIKLKTPEGIEAQSYIDKGCLAPAELVAKIIEKRLLFSDVKEGFILDGYPRSVEQANLFKKMQPNIDSDLSSEDKIIFKVFYFDIPIDDLTDRIIYRASCPKCGKIYNDKFSPPKVKGFCDECKEALTSRKDDTLEVAKVRFNTYFKETEPLVNYYQNEGVLYKIDAKGSIDEVHKRLMDAVNGKCQ